MTDADDVSSGRAEGLPAQANPDALAGLYRAHFNGLVRFLLLNGASWNEAQDAAQDAFVELVRSGSRIEAPAAWLRRVASRMWGKSFVREFPSDTSVIQEQSPAWESPVQAVEIGVAERMCLELIHQLPPKQRAVMAWTFDGFSIEEIATHMGISKDAVRQNLFRARATLAARTESISGRRS
ncbi:RNA polymerase sigma factor [Streptomyces sp. NPDC051985]|uniref:RNA polymerase sigma factor n=1 Tax=Streptomyces sp. NPDC051985 TaxID=3155807 RepID=UPI003439DE44